MAGLHFWKVHGNGNDFVILDDRIGEVSRERDLPSLTVRACARKTGLGADGVLLIQEGQKEGLFRMRLFNADGSEGEMCGNGARCFARMLHRLGLAGAEPVFLTGLGPVTAQVEGERVRLEMGEIDLAGGWFDEPLEDRDLPPGTRWSFMKVGVPHAVLWADSWQDVPEGTLRWIGKKYRHHPRCPQGANVNFAAPEAGALRVRTYERGVEDFTDSCGTGSCACGVVAVLRGGPSPVEVRNPGGMNLVGCRIRGDKAVLSLAGAAVFVAEGVWETEGA